MTTTQQRRARLSIDVPREARRRIHIAAACEQGCRVQDLAVTLRVDPSTLARWEGQSAFQLVSTGGERIEA